jgi:hypothetical protein
MAESKTGASYDVLSYLRAFRRYGGTWVGLFLAESAWIAFVVLFKQLGEKDSAGLTLYVPIGAFSVRPGAQIGHVIRYLDMWCFGAGTILVVWSLYSHAYQPILYYGKLAVLRVISLRQEHFGFVLQLKCYPNCLSTLTSLKLAGGPPKRRRRGLPGQSPSG